MWCGSRVSTSWVSIGKHCCLIRWLAANIVYWIGIYGQRVGYRWRSGSSALLNIGRNFELFESAEAAFEILETRCWKLQEFQWNRGLEAIGYWRRYLGVFCYRNIVGRHWLQKYCLGASIYRYVYLVAIGCRGKKLRTILYRSNEIHIALRGLL